MELNIKTIKVKEYNSSWKNILLVNREPELSDGKIMKVLKNLRN
jgi:hypothetical protein